MLTELSTLTQEVLCEELYIADYKDESNTLKLYLPEKRTVVVLKTLEHAWEAGLVHPRMIMSCLPLISHT